MRRNLPSASSLNRALVCPASTVLPTANTVSDDSNRGTVVHDFLQAVNEKGRDEALAAVPEEYRQVCEALDLAALPTDPDLYAAEVAFAYDVVTGKAREIGRGIGRAYEVGPTEIPGTADVVALFGADTVLVIDWKHGYGHLQHTPPAARNAQLKFYALAACRAYGRSRARIEIIRLTDDGGAWHDAADLEAFDLDSFEFDLKALAAQVERDRAAYAHGEVPPAVVSSACRYCASFAYCGANHALARTMATTPEKWAAEVVALLSPEDAGQAWQRVKQARAVLDRVEEAIETYARQTPVPLGNGIVLAPAQRSLEALDGAVTHTVLAREFGAQFADAACEWKATKKAVESAARGWAKEHGGTLKDAKERALEAVRKAGGVKVSISFPVVEHKQKREAA